MKVIKIGAVVTVSVLALTFMRDVGIGDGRSVAEAIRWSGSKMVDAADGIDERVAAREAHDAEKMRLVVAPLIDQLRTSLHDELAALRRDEPTVPVRVTQGEMARALAKLFASASTDGR